MKFYFKNTIKLGILIFGISLLFWNCEKEIVLPEEINQVEDQESSFSLKHYSRHDIEKNTKLISSLKKFNDKLTKNQSAKTSAKTVYSSEYDFTIYTDAATYIENGDYHSYTFPLVQDADEKMVNVMFELNDQGDYDAYLVNYDYSANELKHQDFSTLSMKTSMKPIDLAFNSLFARTKSAYVCIYSYEYISDGELRGAGNEVYVWVLTASYCETVYYEEEDKTTYNYNNNTATVTISGTTYGGTGGSQTSPTPSPYDAEELIKINAVKSELSLNLPQRQWVDTHGGLVIKLHDNYLAPQMWSGEAKAFSNELIDLARLESNQNDVAKLTNLSLLIENSGNELFTDEFASSLFQYIDIDISTLPPDLPTNFLTLKVYLNYKQLRQLNPEWSRAKCIWYATKEIVRISLDAFGLIPVVGEVADLTNGLIYAIEGDNLNATLSVASAIPFVGYGSVATKYGLKVVNAASTVTTKVKLVWKITANGIDFGSRSQLRKVLGITDSALHAHHIVPWSDVIKNHDVVQKAAKASSAFHMNESLNGIAVAAWRNQPNHNTYNNLIKSKLDALPSNLTPSQAYSALINILNQAKQAILNNPNTHLNDLIF